MSEQWKDIPDFEGYYQISDRGVIKRVTTSYGDRRFLKDKPLTLKIGKQGFLFTSLKKGGKMKTVSPHRLVAELFVPNPDNKPFPRFKDGNKLNICADNLEWGFVSRDAQEGLKRGDISEQGLIFYRYGKQYGNKRRTEYWVTKEKFEELMAQKKGLHRKYRTVYNRDWATTLLDNAKRSSIERGHTAPTITVDWIKQRFEEQGGRCYWLGLPIVITQRSKKLRQPSLDRLQNDQPYTPENTVLSCLFANRGRGANSIEEMEEIKSILSLEEQIIKDLNL